MGSMLMCTACSQVETAEDQNGLRLMKYNGNKDGFYDRDLSDDERFNPDLSPTSYADVTESRPTIGTDQDKIREVIATVDNLTPGSVIINGRDAWVTVHTNQTYTEQQRDQIRHKLLTQITKAVPRYHIHVRVH